MDKDKKEIANRVQQLLVNGNWNLTRPRMGDGVSHADRVSDLETSISVWTPEGRRYFMVKLTEKK